MIHDCFSLLFKFFQLVYFGYSISPFCVLFKYQVTITPETNLMCWCICYMTTPVTCKSMVKHRGLFCTPGSKWFMLIVFWFSLFWLKLAHAGLFLAHLIYKSLKHNSFPRQIALCIPHLLFDLIIGINVWKVSLLEVCTSFQIISCQKHRNQQAS